MYVSIWECPRFFVHIEVALCEIALTEDKMRESRLRWFCVRRSTDFVVWRIDVVTVEGNTKGSVLTKLIL